MALRWKNECLKLFKKKEIEENFGRKNMLTKYDWNWITAITVNVNAAWKYKRSPKRDSLQKTTQLINISV